MNKSKYKYNTKTPELKNKRAEFKPMSTLRYNNSKSNNVFPLDIIILYNTGYRAVKLGKTQRGAQLISINRTIYRVDAFIIDNNQSYIELNKYYVKKILKYSKFKKYDIAAELETFLW